MLFCFFKYKLYGFLFDDLYVIIEYKNTLDFQQETKRSYVVKESGVFEGCWVSAAKIRREREGQSLQKNRDWFHETIEKPYSSLPYKTVESVPETCGLFFCFTAKGHQTKK